MPEPSPQNLPMVSATKLQGDFTAQQGRTLHPKDVPPQSPPPPPRHSSRVRLCVTPQTSAHQAPPSLGFSRQEPQSLRDNKCRSHSPMDRRPRAPFWGLRIPRLTHLPTCPASPSSPCLMACAPHPDSGAWAACSSHTVELRATCAMGRGRSPLALGPITVPAGVSLRYPLPASLLRGVPGEETGSERPAVTTLSCSRTTCV